jgi:UPF0148 protein
MTAEKADEIMAEYLLKGGKMLSKSCNRCGFPLFEYKGETLCVVCPAEGDAAKTAPVAPEIHVQEAGTQAVPAAPDTAYGSLADEVEQAMVRLCERIREEQRPDECLCLMQAVKTGAEALAILRHR